MGMLMVFRALHHHHVDNARAQTAHRPVWYITTRTNRSTLSRQAARRMPDLVPVQSGEDWIARLDDDLSRPVETSGDSFRISALQKEDPVWWRGVA